MSPVGINGVDGQGVGVNGVQVKQALAAGSETVVAGVYDATTLSTIDADLAVGNIADGVTIFGKLGTYEPSLVEDLVDEAVSAFTQTGGGGFRREVIIVSGGDYTLATMTPTFAADSLAVGVGCASCRGNATTTFKLRLYMGGVQVAESVYFVMSPGAFFILVATRALSGAQEIKVEAHNYAGGSVQAGFACQDGGGAIGGGVAVGSIKT